MHAHLFEDQLHNILECMHNVGSLLGLDDLHVVPVILINAVALSASEDARCNVMAGNLGDDADNFTVVLVNEPPSDPVDAKHTQHNLGGLGVGE